MALTVGTGPFGHYPAGVFNREMPSLPGLIYFEDSPRRMRAIFNGETIVDSRHAKLLHEHGHLPIYYFPEDEVRMDLLEATDHHTTCPWKGEASYWSVRVGDRLAADAVWSYPEPLPDAPPLAEYMAFHWDSLDRWLEEDEEVHVHVRDPYHRVDVLPTSRHVRVSLDGQVLADSRRALAVFETSLPTRWYLPLEDVRTELLEPCDLRTRCAYKGFAEYRSVRVGDRVEHGLAWMYMDPRREAAPIAGRLCFFDERVDVEVDGEPQERPRTQWSPH
jgi:uncharacterized protein (DUF427 family)